MKNELQSFKAFLREAKDLSYYQDTFYFTMLISMDKNRGGSRDETKNDLRALPEVLTVTLVEPTKGGVQQDLGTKYLSTLKIHIRRPRDVSKDMMMKRVVTMASRLSGISVLRYKERKPKQRKKAFHGAGSYVKRMSENSYPWQSSKHKSDLKKDFKELTTGGPQTTGGAPFNRKSDPDWESAPPGAAGGLEEALLDEAMKTAGDLPEGVVIVVDKQNSPKSYRFYYAMREDLRSPLKAGDLDRMERGNPVYGVLSIQLGRDHPYDGNYIVESVRAADGYGPLLYDVALETVGKAGLKPDTKTVSDDASRVWKVYDTQREDVQGELLVFDIDQYHTVMPQDRAEKSEENEHLAQVYRKLDKSTTKELESLNKLVEISTAPPIQPKQPSKKRGLGRFNHLKEDIRIAIGSDDFAVFDMQSELNQKIWADDTSIHPGVKAAMMEVIDEFIEGLDLGAELQDVILTGSLANYNWSKFSDIDLHIILDFAEISDNEEMVKKFFDAVRSNWNRLHNITVKGHEIEIYVQDAHEPHVSTGVYSLKEDRWLVKPTQAEPTIDEDTAIKKMKSFAREVDKLSSVYDNGNYEAAFEHAERLREKLKRMRRSGLENGGVYSPENIAFKMLRRSGDIEQMFSIYTQTYDKLHSLDQ